VECPCESPAGDSVDDGRGGGTVADGSMTGEWRPSFWARLLGRASGGSLRVDGTQISVRSDAGEATIPALQHAEVGIARVGRWWQVSLGAASVRGLTDKAIREYREVLDLVVADHDAEVA